MDRSRLCNGRRECSDGSDEWSRNCSMYTRGHVRLTLDESDFIYTGQLYQFSTVFSRGSVRIISYRSSVTTEENLNKTNFIYTG